MSKLFQLRSCLRRIGLGTMAVAGVWATPFDAGAAPAVGPVFREDFSDLSQWRAWEFEKVRRATLYDIREDAGHSHLRMEADQSASGLILARNFPVRENMRIRWRWRADILPVTSDPMRRAGDDYAIRIYVIFEQPVADAGWLERWALRNAPFRAKGVLPERSLVYAWSAKAGLPDFFPNPYTDRVAVFPIRPESGAAGNWREIAVRPVADYRRAFGKEPPAHFRLAVMSDADDSQSRALAWLDYIELL